MARIKPYNAFDKNGFAGYLVFDVAGNTMPSLGYVTATGNVTVSGGVLQFADGGSWRDAVTVTKRFGDGELVVWPQGFKLIVSSTRYM